MSAVFYTCYFCFSQLKVNGCLYLTVELPHLCISIRQNLELGQALWITLRYATVLYNNTGLVTISYTILVLISLLASVFVGMP